MVCSNHEVGELVHLINSVTASVCTERSTATKATTASNIPPLQPQIECGIECILDTPRVCLLASNIASTKHVTAVTLDTDQLTSLLFGMSRNEAQQYMVREIRLLTYLSHHNCIAP
jgi:hypothetical protein